MEKSIQQLAEVIKDYRFGDEEVNRGEEHVEKWLEQFSAEARSSLVEELCHVLERSYFPKSRVVSWLSGLVGAGPNQRAPEFWGRARFITPFGFDDRRSQIELFDQFKRILELEHSALPSKATELPPARGATEFVYLDDGLFTGEQAVEALLTWVARSAPRSESFNLTLVFMAPHQQPLLRFTGSGGDRAKRLRQAAHKEGKDLGEIHVLENFDVVWSQSDLLIDRDSCESERRDHALGPLPRNQTFSSVQSRRMLSREFRQAGVSITRNLYSDQWRPFGKNDFGSLMTTYFNCSNRAPLALWWGPHDRHWEPGYWYPLLPREVNSPR